MMRRALPSSRASAAAASRLLPGQLGQPLASTPRTFVRGGGRRFLETAASGVALPKQVLPAVAYDTPLSGSEEDLTPYCLDLRGLVQRLREELPAKPVRGAPIDPEVVERVTDMLRHTKLNPREWKQYTVFRRGRYTRQIVGYSPGQFIALLLCWGRGQQSPIHDHAGSHCFVKMLSGKLREEQFAWAPGREAAEPDIISVATLDASSPAESVAFAHDDIALHRMVNPDHEEVAVSLHIYSPPFEECLVFPPTGGAARRAAMVSINQPTPYCGPLGASMLQPLGAPQAPPPLSEMCATLTRIGGVLGWEQPAGPGSAPSPAAPDPFAILDLLGPVEMSPMEWATLAGPVHFSEFHCNQNLIHCDDHFSVMVSCWSPGQSIPPHHVGRDRKEWVKVVHGSLTYQEFCPGLFYNEVMRESKLPEGSSTMLIEGSARTRAVANPSETGTAVSIHIFSPPLTQFTFRTEKGIERKCVPMLVGSLAASGGGVSAATEAALEAAREEASRAATSARGMLKQAGRQYLSFRALRKLLDQEFARPDCSDEALTAVLRKAVFNAEEWRELLESAPAPAAGDLPRRVVLADRPGYMLIVNFWGPHAASSLTADRGGDFRCAWTLVLEGELEERAFAPPSLAVNGAHGRTAVPERRLLRVSTLKEESVSFVAGDEEVRLCCDSDVPCVSLHLFGRPRDE